VENRTSATTAARDFHTRLRQNNFCILAIYFPKLSKSEFAKTIVDIESAMRLDRLEVLASIENGLCWRQNHGIAS
jgi:hypothetical protein